MPVEPCSIVTPHSFVGGGSAWASMNIWTRAGRTLLLGLRTDTGVTRRTRRAHTGPKRVAARVNWSPGHAAEGGVYAQATVELTLPDYDLPGTGRADHRLLRGRAVSRHARSLRRARGDLPGLPPLPRADAGDYPGRT